MKIWSDIHCFNTQPPEGGWLRDDIAAGISTVSTHSRLKAAGVIFIPVLPVAACFNTQPPEGGWLLMHTGFKTTKPFQHTAA